MYAAIPLQLWSGNASRYGHLVCSGHLGAPPQTIASLTSIGLVRCPIVHGSDRTQNETSPPSASISFRFFSRCLPTWQSRRHCADRHSTFLSERKAKIKKLNSSSRSSIEGKEASPTAARDNAQYLQKKKKIYIWIYMCIYAKSTEVKKRRR